MFRVLYMQQGVNKSSKRKNPTGRGNRPTAYSRWLLIKIVVGRSYLKCAAHVHFQIVQQRRYNWNSTESYKINNSILTRFVKDTCYIFAKYILYKSSLYTEYLHSKVNKKQKRPSSTRHRWVKTLLKTLPWFCINRSSHCTLKHIKSISNTLNKKKWKPQSH